jgi:hypothetical protein
MRKVEVDEHFLSHAEKREGRARLGAVMQFDWFTDFNTCVQG